MRAVRATPSDFPPVELNLMRNPGGRFGGSGNPFSGGTRIQFGPGGTLPRATKWLLIANAGLFLVSMLPSVDPIAFTHEFGFVPAEAIAGGKLWQFVTYMFLHGSFAHIFINMLMLWMFGTSIERAWGSQPYLWYYAVCGIGGAITTWVAGPNQMGATIGASGAVLGLLLAYAMMYPNRKVYVYFLVPVRMKYMMWFLVAINVFAALSGRQDGIAYFAHLGGMLFGWLYLKQDWRLGALGRKMRAQSARRQMARNADHARKTELSRDEHMREVNRILEKINREGMDSLTPEELRTLREASRR